MEGGGSAIVGTVDRSQGKLNLAEHAFVYTFVKINYHILNYNTIV